MRFVAKRFIRETKQADIQQLRERLFGPHRGLPGERWFARPLDGKTLRQWYFPSKYALQNFRLDEYLEMQTERFAPRPVHPTVTDFAATVQRLVDSQDVVAAFLATLDEQTLANNASVRDLKDLYDLVFASEASDENSSTEISAEQQDELTFLLETLRAHAGCEVAGNVLQQIHSESFSFGGARKMIFAALRSSKPAEKKTEDMTAGLSEDQKKLLNKRYRFIDPLYRRRRVKWMERLLTQKHSAQELKHHSYYKTHPDQQDTFPTNMGPATIKWPSPYQ
jgi:hypothetical protein